MPSSIRIFSGALLGLDALPIEVEVDSTPGLHFFNIVGLPDKTVEESKDRIASAIRNSGFISPNQKNRRIIVNMAPADIKKEGPAYDLPIALGYLLTTSQISFNTNSRLFLGELSLDGSLRRINGVLPITIMAKNMGFKEIFLPKDNAEEASLVNGISIFGASNIQEITDHLSNKDFRISLTPSKSYGQMIAQQSSFPIDMSHIKGQENAKRALTIAATGGHNILLYGPPGTGKTMLSKALISILPDLTYEEALEVTKIYSICGLTNNSPLITTRPFRSPHHTTSAVAVIGGGASPKPGEISLAHHGILFLDELPEFPRDVLESLRQPMESGDVVVSRASGSAKFPSKFLLACAMNPCPCGNYGDDIKACSCSAQAVYRYQKKISGPLLDRIDIQINVPRETYDNIKSSSTGQSSIEIKSQVNKALSIQNKRFSGSNSQRNSEMSPKEIEKYCILSPEAEQLMRSVVTNKGLSGRSYHKILKLARTIADLADSNDIKAEHIAEAISYRVRSNDDPLGN